MREPVSEGVVMFPTVGNWPVKSFERFKDYARTETGGLYWAAIDKLLERSARLDMYEMGMNEVSDESEEAAPVVKSLTLGGDYNE